MRIRTVLAVSALTALLAACGQSSTTASSATGTPGTNGAAEWRTYEREPEYTGTYQMPTQYIVMRDGVKLAADVILPTGVDGQPVTQPLPVILVQTGYNKNVGSLVPALAGGNEFLITRGYVQVVVDVRGTGTSEGEWEAFSETEQEDYKEVMEWVATQPWSNGSVGTFGPSFMAITQLFTAQWQHPAHKAVFAIVPMGDSYRDIVFSGGQVNVGFIPLWLGLVTALSVLPPEMSPSAVPVILEHVLSAVTNFQVPTIAEAILGGENNFDSEYWRTRSTLAIADQIRAPTFIIGGLNDIFQRGEPLLYEAVKENVTAKLLIGPWHHLDASTGAGLPRDGIPDINHLALAWFDRYLKNKDTGAEGMPAVTQYYYGEEKYLTAADWPHPEASADRWYLRGDNSLSRELPAAGEGSTQLLQQPVNGICSQSTSQWTAGLLGLLPLPLECLSTDNSLNEMLLETTFTTAVMAEDYVINGPIEADLWISTTAADAGVLVRVTDVSPDGSSRELTNGILTASLRQIDESRSRYLDGQRIQPWHPFTAESRQPLGSGEIVPVAIEVFPTSAVIKQGHRLRVSVGASDFPHGLPPVPDLLNLAVGVLSIHSDDQHPSSVVLPVLPLSAIH